MLLPIDVNSDAWKRLSEDSRFESIQPICAQFTKQFGDLSKINYIDHTEGCIYVSTALPLGKLIDQLPAIYEGIPIEQVPERETMDSFISTWSMILKQLAGWSRKQIASFANDRHICFRSPGGFHDPCISYISGYLLSDALQNQCQLGGLVGLQMTRRIEHEIDAGRSHKKFTDTPDLDPYYNWDAARERILFANQEMESKYLQ